MQPATGTVRSRRTRSTCKDRSSGASISRFAVAVSRFEFAVGTRPRGEGGGVVRERPEPMRYRGYTNGEPSYGLASPALLIGKTPEKQPGSVREGRTRSGRGNVTAVVHGGGLRW